MSGITLAEAEATLDAYRTAELKVLTGQSYSIGGRSLTRANLKDIREGITYWQQQVGNLARGGIRASHAVPR
jgi:hypothetical protein